jgi:hypothetical protein
LIKQTAEEQKKTDEQMKKTDEQMKRTDERLDRLSRNVDGLNNSMGQLIETLIGAGIGDKFKGFNLKRVFRRVPIYNEKNRVLTDIDILLSNTAHAMGVEVKDALDRTSYVDKHLERMALIRKYPPAEIKINNKRLMGALAGGFADPDVTAYAYKCGFFALELTGESVSLVPPPDGFTPGIW